MINAYVYKVTNTITEKFYIGYRYKNQKLKLTPLEDLWIKYFTSSNRVKNEIEIYGKNSFIVEILYENPDSLECWKQEQIFIRDNWTNPNILNGKYHDPDSNVEIYRRNMFLTDDTRKKMSESGKRKIFTEEHTNNIRNALIGKKGSPEKSRKISLLRMGKPATNKGVTPPKYKCIHCNALVSMGNLNRWHKDKCKLIDPIGHKNRSNQIATLNKK